MSERIKNGGIMHLGNKWKDTKNVPFAGQKSNVSAKGSETPSTPDEEIAQIQNDHYSNLIHNLDNMIGKINMVPPLNDDKDSGNSSTESGKLGNENESPKNTIEQPINENESLKKENEELIRKNEGLNKIIEQLMNENKSLEGENERLKKENEKARAIIAETNRRLKEIIDSPTETKSTEADALSAMEDSSLKDNSGSAPVDEELNRLENKSASFEQEKNKERQESGDDTSYWDDIDLLKGDAIY